MADISIDTLITQFKELSDAAFNSQFGMNVSDFLKVDRMKDRYLGEDIVLTSFGAKFIVLPEDKKNKMKQERNYGEYGVMHHARKGETTSALCVLAALTAREILQAGNVIEDEHLKESILLYAELEPKQIELYRDNDFISKIIATFPDGKITRENFATATQPFQVPT